MVHLKQRAVRYALVDLKSAAFTQLKRRESSASTQHATSCLRAPNYIRWQYSPRRDSQIFPTCLQVDSTHLHVRRVVTMA